MHSLTYYSWMLWIIKVDVTRVMNIKKSSGPKELDPLCELPIAQ